MSESLRVRSGRVMRTVALPRPIGLVDVPADWASRAVAIGLIALYLISLARPANLDLQVASWLTFLALVIMPGYLLADLVTRVLGLDALERLAVAFPLSIVIMSPVGEAALIFHLTVQQLAAGWVASAGAVLLLWVVAHLRDLPARPQLRWRPDELVLLLGVVAAFLYVYPALTTSFVDGDDYMFLTYVSSALTGRPMLLTEPLFNTNLGPGVRMDFNMFVPLWTMWSHWLSIDPIALTAAASRATFAVWAILASYTLGKAAGGTRRVGLLTASVQMLIYLAAPFLRDDNVRLWFFTRVNVDKYTVAVTMLPLVLAFAIHYLRSGRVAALGVAAASAFALSTIHPLVAAMAALGLASFGGLHLLLNLRDRGVWRKVAALAVAIGVAMVVPCVQLLLTIVGPAFAPTYPRSLDGWSIADRLTPALPFVQVRSLDLFGPQPNLSYLDASQANTAASPFLIWRFAVNLLRDRLIIFDLHHYISNPSIFLEPPYLLALLLLPVLLWRIRSHPGAQLALSATLGAIVVMYNPILTPRIGALVVPWLLWRIVWLPPFALIIVLAVDRLIGAAAWGIGRLAQRQRVVRAVATYGPLGLLIAVGALSWSVVATNQQDLLTRPAARPYNPAPLQILSRLANETARTGPVVVAADQTVGVALPAYAGNAKVIGYRVFNTSETFPADQQDQALQRLIDQNYLFTAPALTPRSVDILRRYDVRYVIAPSGGDLDGQLRLAPRWFTWLLDDESYSLYAVQRLPTVTTTVQANDALARHDWNTAGQLYLRALEADPTDVLARVGLAGVYRGRGQLDLAASALGQALTRLDVPILHYELGQVYADRGQSEQSRAELDLARQRAPLVGAYHWALGDACLAAGQDGCAADQYRAAVAVTSYPNDSARLIALGDAWRQRGKTDRAVSAYDQALKLGLDRVDRLNLATTLQKMGQLDRAEVLLRTLGKENPFTADVVVGTANLRAAQGKLDQAAGLFRQASWLQGLEIKDTIGTHVAAAQALASNSRFSEARDEIDRALKLRSHDAAAYVVLGNLYALQFQPDPAIAAYEQALQLDPTTIAAYLSASSQFQGQVATGQDEAMLQNGTRINPDVPTLFLALGNLSEIRGQSQEAIRAYGVAGDLLHTDAVTSKLPRAAVARERAVAAAHLAAIYEDQGSTATAMDYYHAAANADFGEPWSAVLLANALRRRDDPAGAETIYRRVMASFPTYVDAYVQLASLEDARGDSAAAKPLIDQAQQLLASQPAQQQPVDATVGLAALFGQMHQPAANLGSGVDDLSSSNAVADAASQGLLSAYLRVLDVNQSQASVDGLARLYETMNQPDQAVQLYQKMIQQGQGQHWSVLTLSRYYKGLGDVYASEYQLDPAIEAYQHAIALDRWWPAARAGLVAALLARGDRAGALSQAQQAVAISPGSAEARLALGNVLDQSGERDRALAAFQSAAQAHPGYVPASVALGNALAGQGRWGEADQVFHQAIAATPGDPRPYDGLGRLDDAQGRYSEGEAWFDHAIQVDHRFAGAYADLGNLQARLGRYSDALETYDQGLRANARDWHIYLGLGSVDQALGEADRAIEALRAATTIARGFPEPLLQLASVYQEQGDGARAEAALRQATGVAPGSPAPWVALGDYQLAAGKLADALASYQSAISASPEAASGYAAYGRALLAAGRSSEALDVVQKGTRAAARDPAAWVALGDALRGRDRRDEAVAAYQRAIDVDPSSAVAPVARGVGLLDLGRRDDALAALTAATRAHPGDAPAFEALGQAREATGDLAGAEAAYRQAIALVPTEPSAYARLGRLLLAQRRPDDALVVERRLADVTPGRARSFLALGDALSILGRSPEAIDVLRQAQRLEPGDAPAGIALAKAQLGAGLVDAAAAAIQRVLDQQPGNVAGLLTQGQVRERMLRWSDAEQSYRAAINLSQDTAAPRLALGDFDAKRGMPDAAVAAYQGAVLAEPSNVAAQVKLGRAYLRYGPTTEARKVFEQAAADVPWVATPYVGLGDTWLHQGDLDRALEADGQGIAADPQDPTPYAALATVHAAAGDYAQAAQDDRRALDVGPIDGNARLGLARLLLATNDRAGALREARQAIADAPRSAAAYVTLADVLRSDGQWADAGAALDRALALDPSSSGAWVGRALLARDQSDLSGASDDFQQATAIAPGDPAVWLALGDFQLSQKQSTAALDSFGKAIAQAAGESAGYVALGRAYLREGRWDDALVAGHKAIDAQPGDGAGHAVAGDALLAMNRVAEAASAFRDATAINPGYAPGFVGLGDILVRQADFPGAIRAYEQSARLPTSGSAGDVRLGDLYLRIGPVDDALAAFRRALDRDPAAADAQVGIGNAYRHLGRLDDAVAAYAAASRVQPPQSLGDVAVAEGKLAVGDFGGARSAYQQALAITPDDLAALTGLARLASAVGSAGEARAVAQQALSAHRDDAQAADAAVALGDVLATQKQYGDADRAYEEALRDRPSFAPALRGLAQLLAAQGRTAEARRAFQDDLTAVTNDPTLWLAWAQFLTSQNDDAAAASALDRAIALAPGEAVGYVGQARVAAAQNRSADAVTLLRKAISVEPGSPEAHVNLGHVLAPTQPDVARSEFEAALRVQPSFASAYLGLGDLLAQQADFAGAIRAYQQNVQLPNSRAAGYVHLGDLYLRIGPVEQATGAFTRALSRDPSDVLALVGLGNAQRNAGQLASALASYRAATRADATQAAGFVALAEGEVATGDFAGARAAYQHALATTPNEVAAQSGLARLETSLGNTAAATTVAEQAVAAHQSDAQAPLAQVALGDVLSAQQQYAAAERAYREALRLSPSTTAAYVGLAQLEAAQQQVTAARGIFQDATRAAPNDPKVWQAWAQFLASQKDDTGADQAFARAVALAPGEAAGYVGRGLVAEAEGQDVNAAAFLGQAVAVQPGSSDAHASLARVLMATQPDSARAEFGRAHVVQPAFARAYLDEGDFLLTIGEPAGATEAYRKYPDVAPTSPAAYLRLAEVYLESGHAGDARTMLARASSLGGPGAAATHVAVGDLYLRMGRATDAVAAYRQALGLDGTSVPAYVGLARALAVTGQTDAALAVARQAIQAFPGRGDGAVLLGDLYDQTGNAAAAATAYHQAIQSGPNDATAYFDLARLQFRAQANRSDTIALYERGLAVAPTDDLAYAGLTHLYGDRDIWAAVNRYTALARSSPSLLWPIMSLGASYERWAQLESALAAYQQAQQVAPDFTALYCRRGVISTNLSRFEDARRLLGICLASSAAPPQASEARAALRRILENHADVQVSAPAANAALSGVVTVRGIAKDPRFQYYKLEYRAAGSAGVWQAIGAPIYQAIGGGTLGSWDTRGLPPGRYVLRLVVVDQSGQFSHPGEVEVQVK